MSTLKVDTIDTTNSTGNIIVSRPLSGSGASLTNLPAANLTGTLPAIDGSNLTGVAPTKAAVEALGIDLPAANLTGTVATARLGSGTANNTVFLRGDGTWTVVDTTNASNLSTGTLPIARIADDAVTNAKMADDAIGVAQLSATGTASSSTFLRGDNVWAASGATVSASDPAIDTNATLGTQWANSTSGEFYVLTDATAGANVWTNVGEGTGNITPYSYMGDTNGFSYSGYGGGGAGHSGNVDKLVFATEADSTDIGDMSVGRQAWGACSSSSEGFAAGGYRDYPPAQTHTIIDKLSFSSGGTMSDHGDIIVRRQSLTGSSDSAYGYLAVGNLVSWDGGSGCANYSDVQRFAFSSNTTASDIGDLITNNGAAAGHTDATNSVAFVAGGAYCSGQVSDVNRYTQASSLTANDVGDLSRARGNMAGTSSTTEGFSAGGGEASIDDRIDRYTFSTSVTATDQGNLSVVRFANCGVSHTSKGYSMAGMNPDGGSPVNIIDRWSTASYGDAVDVANTSVAAGYMGGEGSQV